MNDKVLLVGLTGSGTSTVGAALATRLGWPYLDDDTLMVRTAGSTASELLATQGDEAVRAAESRVLTLMLGMPGPVVCSLPSRVVEDEANRERLTASGAHVVWLRATPAVLARRLLRAAGRVRQAPEVASRLDAQSAGLDGLFEEVADQVVDVDAIPAGAAAKLVVEALAT